jgi:glucokinase
MHYLVGVDVRGTNISSGLVSSEGKIIKRATIPSQSDMGEKVFLDNIKKAIRSVIRKGVTGIGIGCPGPLDPDNGVILNPPNIPLRNLGLKDIIEKEFGIPVRVHNDAACFVLGESVFGQANDARVVIGLTIGTGLGGGIVINKEIFHGSGNAGQFFCTTINHDGTESKFGIPGAAEEYVSERGIMRLANGIGASEPAELFEMAMRGNKDALKAFEELGRYLGIVALNAISSFDPDAVVIGGSISKSREFFQESMKRELEKAVFNNARIIFSEDTEMSSLLGAASLVLPSIDSNEGKIAVNKPWGDFTQYALNRKCTVKVISVKKDSSLSLQSHRNRDELWVAMDNGLIVEIDGRTIKPKKGEEVFIPRESRHRLSSMKSGARILEISFGEFDEDDIVRHEDMYGRVST